MTTREYYDLFDVDGSGEIELDEFMRMLEKLDILVEERLVQMCFRLFDREENDFFGYKMFEDIIEGNIIPNFINIVKIERERWLMRDLIALKKSRK